MVRHLYAPIFVQLAGTAAPAPNLPFTVWTDLTAGTNVTAQLVVSDASSAYTPVTDSQGNIAPFRGPDGFQGSLFADTGAAYRFELGSPTLIDYIISTLANILANGAGNGVTDHGALSGLGDDDHPQYHNDTRGDARYYLKSAVDAAIANAVAASSTEDRKRANHSGTQLASSISDFTSAVQAVAGSGGGGGAPINDTTASTTTVYSSSKVNTLVAGKADLVSNKVPLSQIPVGNVATMAPGATYSIPYSTAYAAASKSAALGGRTDLFVRVYGQVTTDPDVPWLATGDYSQIASA